MHGLRMRVILLHPNAEYPRSRVAKRTDSDPRCGRMVLFGGRRRDHQLSPRLPNPCPAGSGPSVRGFFFRFHRSRISSRRRWSSSNSNCLMATASALSRSGASTEPRYSPLLRMMMTRQLRRFAGFLGLVRRDMAPNIRRGEH
jgi:hypothetical protein